MTKIINIDSPQTPKHRNPQRHATSFKKKCIKCPVLYFVIEQKNF